MVIILSSIRNENRVYHGRLFDCLHRLLSILILIRVLKPIARNIVILRACLVTIAANCVDIGLSSCNGAILISDNLVGSHVALTDRILSLYHTHINAVIYSLLIHTVTN